MVRRNSGSAEPTGGQGFSSGDTQHNEVLSSKLDSGISAAMEQIKQFVPPAPEREFSDQAILTIAALFKGLFLSSIIPDNNKTGSDYDLSSKEGFSRYLFSVHAKYAANPLPLRDKLIALLKHDMSDIMPQGDTIVQYSEDQYHMHHNVIHSIVAQHGFIHHGYSHLFV